MALAIVTGATGGLGFETALGLARAGHDVMMTGRDPARGTAAAARVAAERRGTGRVWFAPLDVASLDAVAAFAATIDRPVGVLVCNAGVMALPRREQTVDGFERQLGTNFLGQFALAGRLLPMLRGGRVVPVASLAHRRGRIDFEDLQGERRYSPWAAYAQSKLACLMWGLEFQVRSDAGSWGVTSIAAHPGWAASRLVANGVGLKRPGLRAAVMQLGFNAMAQSTAAGALPLLHAALDPAAQPGGYYGPCCWTETRGRPAPSRIMPQASDPEARVRLWDAAERLTGVRYSPRVLT